MRSTFILALLLIIPGMVLANKIVVGKDEVVKSIKEAIQNSSAGDTIYVKTGVYKEGNIVIQKSISLIGENFPVLDGENKYEILTINANNVRVQGFYFKDTGIASIEDL